MKKFLFLQVFSVIFFCCCLTGCGDAVPWTTQIAADLTQKYNDTLDGRDPQIIVQQFFDALCNADFQRAAMYCSGDMKLFMEQCAESKRMQTGNERDFSTNHFVTLAKSRFDKIKFVSEDYDRKNNTVTLTYCRAGYEEILSADKSPKVFELAKSIFPQNVTAKKSEKRLVRENIENNFSIKERSAFSFKVILVKNGDGSYKITEIKSETDKDTEKETEKENPEEFGALPEFSSQKKTQPAAGPREEQGMAGNDSGFENIE